MLRNELLIHVDPGYLIYAGGNALTDLNQVVTRLIQLREGARDVIRAGRLTSEVLQSPSSEDQILISMRDNLLLVSGELSHLTELLHDAEVRAFFEDTASDKLNSLLEAEEESVRALKRHYAVREAELAAVNDRYTSKKMELERLDRRLNDLKAGLKVEPDENDRAELAEVYAEYVTKYMNLEFINHELRKLGPEIFAKVDSSPSPDDNFI